MMTIIINDRSHSYNEDSITIEEILHSMKKSNVGTAVALNGMLIRKVKWAVTLVKDGDCVTIISAAFGG